MWFFEWLYVWIMSLFIRTVAGLSKKYSCYYRTLKGESPFKELHKNLHKYVRSLEMKECGTNLKLLYKGGFLLLYDTKLKKTITSFEIINREYPIKSTESENISKKKKKTNSTVEGRRPKWVNDPQQPEAEIGENVEGYDKGHIATYCNHEANEGTRKESCYKTNGFLQVPNYHAYADVEEWASGLQLHGASEVLVVTHLVHKHGSETPTSVLKILQWKVDKGNPASVIVIFQFPNIDLDDKNKQKGNSYKFMKTEKVLEHLPFRMELKNPNKIDTTTYREDPKIKGWKNAIIKALKDDKSKQSSAVLML